MNLRGTVGECKYGRCLAMGIFSGRFRIHTQYPVVHTGAEAGPTTVIQRWCNHAGTIFTFDTKQLNLGERPSRKGLFVPQRSSELLTTPIFCSSSDSGGVQSRTTVRVRSDGCKPSQPKCMLIDIAATHNATHNKSDLHVLRRTYAAVRDL